MPPLPRRWAIALDVVALAFVAVAAVNGQRVTADLEWPGDPDMFRDLAVAQSLRDCWCLADPHYRGELIWYNPLTAGVVAALAAATDRPVNLVQVRDGAYLNLLAPLGFYVLAVTLVGRLAALPALVAFLFLSPGRLFDSATYSPWLMSPNFAQAFLYLGLAAYVWAAERERRWPWIGAGVVAGSIVLGHTAAALLLAGVVAADTAATALASADRARVLRDRALMAGTAAIVASPLLYPVLWHYQGQILNGVPTVWIDRSMELERWATFVRTHLARPVMVAVAAGVAAMAAGVVVGRRRRILAAWASICVAFLTYSFVWQWQRARGVTWPTIVPEFHFLRLLDGAEHVWFGLGIAAAASWLASRLVRVPWRDRLSVAVVGAVAVAASAAAWPAYRQRHDRVAMRTSSLAMFQDPEHLLLHRWIRTYSAPTDVFLADPNVSFSVVAPAGRRVVEVPAAFSNTFVDWGEHHDAASSMWAALTASNCEGLSAQAERYGVTHAIDERTARWTRSIRDACGWTPVLTGERWVVFARPRR